MICCTMGTAPSPCLIGAWTTIVCPLLVTYVCVYDTEGGVCWPALVAIAVIDCEVLSVDVRGLLLSFSLDFFLDFFFFGGGLDLIGCGDWEEVIAGVLGDGAIDGFVLDTLTVFVSWGGWLAVVLGLVCVMTMILP